VASDNADPGIDEVLAAEATVADARAGAADARAEARAEAAQPEPAAGETAEPRPRRIRSVFVLFRELVRAAATAYVSAYVSLVIWSMLPMTFGWTPTVIISGSMTPQIKIGDVVFFAPENPATIAPGRVVLVDDPEIPGRLLSHRIYERKQDGSIVTKGDANAAPDPTPVRPDHIHGAARLVIPFVGRVTLWKGENRKQAMVWTGITAFALLMARSPGRLKAEAADPEPDGELSPEELVRSETLLAQEARENRRRRRSRSGRDENGR
jgi:signal peptidase